MVLSASSSQRIPAKLYYLGVAVLLLAAIVAVVLLARHEADAIHRPGTTSAKIEPREDRPGDPRPVIDRIEPSLIDESSVTPTHQGLSLTGSLTELAEQSPATASAHITSLLDEACLNAFSLATTDNMQVDLFGYCYDSPDTDLLSQALSTALENDADALSILKRTEGGESLHYAEFIWFAQTSSEYETLKKSLETSTSTAGFDAMRMTVYGPEEVTASFMARGDAKPAVSVAPHSSED